MSRSAALILVLILTAGCAQSPPDSPRDAPPTNAPEWAAETIWYQIFPERFRNGDPGNDPVRASLPDPERVPVSWQTTAWTSDWYARAPWELERSDNFYRTVRDRRYGGDLQGVLDKLEYLETLGITGIYFNPLFWARSEHKYDGNTFHHIDPYFGPDPGGDFELMDQETSDPSTWNMTAADSLFFALVAEAHERGIRVIIDGVFNHTGRDFFAFRDLYENQRESAYTEWYTVKAWDDPATDANEFDWEGWWGYKPLPELADNAAGDDLHPGPKAYVFDATARWMDPNGDGDPSDGVDGWRLDVVADVPVGFWADWNAHVRSINAEAYTVAELWEDASATIRDGGFSASMNYYGFAFPTKGFLIDGRMPATDFLAALDSTRGAHTPVVASAMQNLIDSHDTERVASMISNASRELPYEREDSLIWWDYDWGDTGGPSADENYLLRAPTDSERRIQRLVALFQMTYVGAPMIYYGTEAGMWGGDDPDDRQPMLWYDLEYAPQSGHPRGLSREAEEWAFDPELHLFYKQVIGLRRSHVSLAHGEFLAASWDNAAQTVAYTRRLDDELLLTILNRSEEDQTVRVKDLPLDEGEGLYPIFSTTGSTEQIVPAWSAGEMMVRVPALTGIVLIRTGVE